MAKGKVRSYDDERGFGFIRSPEAPDDVFFHFKDIVGSEEGPLEGATVEFTLTEGERGPKATGVRVESRRTGGGAPERSRPTSRGGAGGGAVQLREFRREVTEILLSVDGLTSGQIRDVRDFLTDYGIDRGFVADEGPRRG
ncbi:cold-shock protein [Kineococcus sp. SYSU DK003]|uniref:cold-shock protein n=1 Tax=Kineococcus sp. SYSU DK003 TaxID=3383124 RepID=UPI003D7E748D